MGQFDNELKSKQQKLNKSTTSTPTIGGEIVRSPLHMKGRRGWQNGHMIKVVNGKEVDNAVVVVPTDVVDILLDDEDDDEDGENAKPWLSSNIRSGTKTNDQSWQRRGKDVLSPAKHQSPHSKKSLNDTATTKAATATAVVVGPNTTNNTTMAMRIPLTETKNLHTPTTKITTTTTTTTPPVTSTNNLQRHSPSRCSPSPATLSRRRLQQRAAVFKMGDSSPTKPVSVIGNNKSVLFNNIMNSSSSLDDAAVLVLSERNQLGSSNDGEKDTLTYETTIINKTNNIGGGGGAVLKTSTSPSRYSTQKITLTKKSEEGTPTNKSKEERDDTYTTREEGNDETTREEEEDIPLKPFDATVDFASKRQAWANKFEKNKNKVASAQRLQHSSSRSPTKRNNQDSSSSSEGGVVPFTSSSKSESATISPVSKALMNSPSKYQHRQPSTVAVNAVNDRANISMPMKEIPAELAKPISQLYEKFDKKRQCHHNKGSVMKEPMVMYKKDDTISNSDLLPVFKQEVKNWSPTNSTPTQANTSQLFTISLTEVISMTTSPKEDMSVSSLREEKKIANCTTKDDTEFETKWTSTIDFTNPSSDPFPIDPDELFFASNEFDSDGFSDAIMSTLKPKGFDDKEENDDEDNTDTFLSTFGEEVFNQVNTNNSQETDVEFNKEHDEEDLDTISSAFGDEVFDQAKDSTLDTSMMKATLDGQEEDTQTSTSGTSGWVAVKQGNFYEWSKQEAKRIDNERAASEIGNIKGHVGDDIAMIEESFKAGLSHEQKYLFTTIIARYETLITSRQSEMESLMSESSLQQKQINTLLGIQKQIQLLVAKEQEPKPEHDHEKIECLNVEISNLRLQLAACEAALNQDSRNSNGNTASSKKNFMMSFWSKKKKSMRSQSKYYDDEVENESDI